MALLTSLLMSILALLVGVEADVTLWRTSTCTETAWSTQVMAANTVWSTETYTYIPPAITVPYTITSILEKSYTDTLSIPYTVTSVIESDFTDVVTSTVEHDYTTTITETTVVESDYTNIITSTVEHEYTTTITETTVVESGHTDTVTSTVEHDYTATITETSVSVSVIASLATEYSDHTATLTSVVISITTVLQSGPTITQVCTPVTINQPTTVIITPATITAYTTSSSTGLVPCPSRTINPTYTTSSPLPNNYTWGCPPGYLCKPPQVNCNFESNPPADTYYCSPDECVLAPPLPSFDQTGAGGSNGCGPYPTVSGYYFNFNPDLFGLTFGIFTEGGDYAETCLGCAMSTLMPVSQISDGQPQAPTMVCETTVAPVTTISDGQPEGPLTTTVARLARRAVPPLPQVCYDDCDQCLLVAEHDGKQPNLCSDDSQFSAGYRQCNTCLSIHRTDTRTEAGAVLPALHEYTSYCNTYKNAATSQPLVVSTTSSLPSSTASQKSTSASPKTPAAPSSSKSSTPSTSKQSTHSVSSVLHSSSASSALSSGSSPPSLVPTSSPSSTTVSIPASSLPPPPPPPASIPSPTTVSIQPTSTTPLPPTGTPTVCAVSQISDGQPQACASTATAVSQISDGQPQAPTTSIATFTGAAGHAVSPPCLFWSSPMGWALLLFVNALPL